MINKDRVILAYFYQSYLGVLIPKKRGNGYLKVPLGHHACPLAELEREIEFDIYGLSGELEVMTGFITDARHKELEDRVLKPISELLGYSYRIVDRFEYFQNFPIGNKSTPYSE